MDRSGECFRGEGQEDWAADWMRQRGKLVVRERCLSTTCVTSAARGWIVEPFIEMQRKR